MTPDYCDRCDCLRPTVREYVDHATGLRARICLACYREWDEKVEGMHDVEEQPASVCKNASFLARRGF